MEKLRKLRDLLAARSRSHPLRAVALVFLPILAMFGLAGGIAWLGARYMDTEYEKPASYDMLLINEQVKRVKQGERGDIVIFGDSSGLMGIDPLILEKELGRRVQNFCTLAFAGPRGCAIVLEEYLKRNPVPELIIFAFHPIQLIRQKQYDNWPKYIRKSFDKEVAPPTGAYKGVKNALSTLLYDHVLYVPLRGSSGGYYGSPKAVQESIRAGHGGVIDPNVIFLKDVQSGPKNIGFQGLAEGYVQNLQVLREVVDKYGLKDVVLLRTPVAQHYVDEKGALASAYRDVAKNLAIEKDAGLLEGLAFFPDKYFSTMTHLNRYGKAEFSRALAEKIKPLLADAGREEDTPSPQ